MNITIDRPALSAFDKTGLALSFISLTVNIALNGLANLGAVGAGAGIGYLLYHIEARRKWGNLNGVTISLNDGPLPRTEIATVTVTAADREGERSE